MKLDHEKLYLLTSVKTKGLIAKHVVGTLLDDVAVLFGKDCRGARDLRDALLTLDVAIERAFKDISKIHDDLHEAGLLKDA